MNEIYQEVANTEDLNTIRTILIRTYEIARLRCIERSVELASAFMEHRKRLYMLHKKDKSSAGGEDQYSSNYVYRVKKNGTSSSGVHYVETYWGELRRVRVHGEERKWITNIKPTKKGIFTAADFPKAASWESDLILSYEKVFYELRNDIKLFLQLSNKMRKINPGIYIHDIHPEDMAHAIARAGKKRGSLPALVELDEIRHQLA